MYNITCIHLISRVSCFQVVRYILDRNTCLLPAYFVINEVNHLNFVTDECMCMLLKSICEIGSTGKCLVLF